MHGSGNFEWPDGRRYSGQYFKDKKHGEGILTLLDGRKIAGIWLNGEIKSRQI